VPVLASPPHQRDEMSMISLVFFFENEAYWEHTDESPQVYFPRLYVEPVRSNLQNIYMNFSYAVYIRRTIYIYYALRLRVVTVHFFFFPFHY
jgi:hypothetical protein